MHNGQLSFWMQQRGLTTHTQTPSRPTVDGSVTADVCIIGAGFTGLWLAYHLKQLDPSLDIAIVEQHVAGYGASGRNAGWLSPLVPGNRRKFAQTSGSREAGVHLQRRMLEAVDEVLDIIRSESIDAKALRSGNLVVARTPAAMQRLRGRLATDQEWGYTADEGHLLSAAEFDDRIRVAGAVGGLFYPTVGRIDPAGLVQGLAHVVERMGVTIYEHSRAVSISAGSVTTEHGSVTARSVLRCTEGYSASVASDPRRIIPINSSIIVTDPITDDLWRTIGWEQSELFSDAAHVFSYAQKTADGRILIGGRGNPYRYASGTGAEGEIDAATLRSLTERLHRFFPAIAEVPIAHAWSGVLGVTRDWCASVRYDPGTGLGHAQGYAGHGVTSAYLAAKSLAETVAGGAVRAGATAGALAGGDTRLPWNGRQTRNWEPEPIRWIGVHAMYRMFEYADRFEERSNAQNTSWLAQFGSRFAGLHE